MQRISDDLCHCPHWFVVNNLKLNSDKTKVIGIFSNVYDSDPTCCTWYYNGWGSVCNCLGFIINSCFECRRSYRSYDWLGKLRLSSLSVRSQAKLSWCKNLLVPLTTYGIKYTPILIIPQALSCSLLSIIVPDMFSIKVKTTKYRGFDKDSDRSSFLNMRNAIFIYKRIYTCILKHLFEKIRFPRSRRTTHLILPYHKYLRSVMWSYATISKTFAATPC